MNAELCREAVELFRSTPVYDRLLKAVKARYQSLGRVGGTVSLTNLTPADREALSRFFGCNYSQQERVRISVQAVADVLEATKFAAISLIELLEAYFGEALVTETERAEEWQQQWEQLFAALLQRFPHEYCQQWLGELLQKHSAGYKLVLKKFNTDRKILQKDLATVCTALSNLPVFEGKLVRLPIFAAGITTDPHGLDHWTDPGNLFQAALVCVFGQSGPVNGEQQVLLYRQAGILKGDITSYVTTYGLMAYADSESHPLWQGAMQAREVLQLTLDNLIRVERVTCAGNRVYVVENPAVFAELVEACGERERSIICSNGQLRLATWVLLDLLVEGGAQIYYSGDFDPEGLQIAQKLAERYPANVTFWHYTVEDYAEAVSELELSERRLSKLAGVVCEELVVVKEAILARKRAGYQEQLVGQMARELQGWSLLSDGKKE